MRRLLLCVLVAVSPVVAHAQGAHLPAPVSRGLTLLQADSVHAAVQAWAAAWTGPTDAGKAEQLETSFAQLETLAGKMKGYDVIGVDTITPHLLRVYALLRYDVPVYTQFVVYDRGGAAPQWMVATVRYHTDPTQVLPAEIWKQ